MKEHYTRRRVLGYTFGGVAATAAGGSLAVIASENREEEAEAYSAWRQKDKGAYGDLEYLVMCAGLAPSAHNTQPWRFRLDGDRIDLYADLDRHLGKADPERRMMQVSLGCALENLHVAARRLGYDARVEAKDADARFAVDGHVARVRLLRGAVRRDPWFDAIFERRTSRGVFDAEVPVPITMTAALEAATGDLPGVGLRWLEPEPALQRLVRSSVRGYLTRSAHRDGMAWFRITRDEWERKRDGIAIFTSDAPFYAKRYVEWFATKRDLLGEPFRQGEVAAVDRVVEATPLWGLVHAVGASPSQRVLAGRLAERVYLEATARGLAVQPLCYATEVPAEARRLSRLAGLPPAAEPLFLFRLGRGRIGGRSVRRDVRDLLMA